MKLSTKILACFTILFPAYTIANTIYVNHSAQGQNNGSDWQNAFIDLQDALSIVQYGDTVWVAEGTYYPTAGNDRNISLVIPNGVAIFGGFQGTETQLSERNWEDHPTILSGDIGEQGDHSDNAFSVLYASQTDTTTTLDGLVIMHGNANSAVIAESTIGTTKCGGGLYLYGQGTGNFASIKINNCKFLENYAVYYGGAIFFSGFGGSLDFIISNSVFENNESGNAGGAIGKRGGCNLVQNLISCTFENNRSEVGGAYSTTDLAIAIDLNIQDCIFMNNKANAGTAIARKDFGPNTNNLKISDCSFKSNTTLGYNGYGNTIFEETGNSFGNIYITDSDFENGTGEAIYCTGIESRVLVVSNCNFKEYSCDCASTLIFIEGFKIFSYNNLFFKNEFKSGTCISGGISKEIINNTFYKNKAGSLISGIGATKVFNSIFWENEVFALFLNNNNLEIGASIFDVDSCDLISPQNSVISCHPDVLFNVDPLFKDTANLDFSLLSCSPAINAGQTSIIDSLGILEDLAGNDRIIDGVVDIGAFEQAAFSASIESVQHESCFGNSNGAVYLNISGNPPFDILWQSGNDSGTNTTDLSPGVFDFVIIDADGCSDTLTVEIEPALGLTTNFESNDASSANSADGSIFFEVISGGTPGYTFEWNTGDTTPSISGLFPGNYFLTVTDAINCKYGFGFSVGYTNGIDEVEDGVHFRIHPNPVDDLLTIKTENPTPDSYEFQLYDELGRLVLTTYLPALASNFQISVAHIPSGFYHYYILKEKAVVKVEKLVVY